MDRDQILSLEPDLRIDLRQMVLTPEVDLQQTLAKQRAEAEGSRPGYRDMQVFIAGLDDAQIADRLDRAISGRGAFRRFKDTRSAWLRT